MTVIGVVAPGAMGSGVAARLVANGVRVLTVLEGRSDATRSRAVAAGMEETGWEGLAAADIILSIVPPGEAMGLAERLAPVIGAADRKPIYVDCNALDVGTVEAVGRRIVASGGRFVDAGIIGLPPKPGSAGPKFHLSGEGATMVAAALADGGLVAEPMDAAVGAASALKMSYAGITKGLTALATIMILAAERAGAADALRAELAASQPQLMARFASSLPDMVPKAYRWVAEMHEIASFMGEDAAGAAVFRGIADLYERIAKDASGARAEVRLIEGFAKPA